MPISRDGYLGPYVQFQLARIYLLVGEPELALDPPEGLLKVEFYLSVGWLRIDPEFGSLRRNGRFERMVRQQYPGRDPEPRLRAVARHSPLRGCRSYHRESIVLTNS